MLGGGVGDQTGRLRPWAAFDQDPNGGGLAVQGGTLLRVDEAYGQDLAAPRVGDDATERRVGVAARDPYGPPHVTLVIRTVALPLRGGPHHG